MKTNRNAQNETNGGDRGPLRCVAGRQHSLSSVHIRQTVYHGKIQKKVEASCSANWALKYDGTMWELWNPNWFIHLSSVFVNFLSHFISNIETSYPICRWFMECSGALDWESLLSHNELERWNYRISFNKVVWCIVWGSTTFHFCSISEMSCIITSTWGDLKFNLRGTFVKCDDGNFEWILCFNSLLVKY